MEELKNNTSNPSEKYSKRHWRDEEDKLLYRLVEENGPRNWSSIAQRMQGRSGKSCRLRWVNQLAPHVKRTPLNYYEEQKLLYLHRIFGSKWSTIAHCFPGRTDNQLKNQFHAIMARNRRHFTNLTTSLVWAEKDQLHAFNHKVMDTFPNALLEQLRIPRLLNSSNMENILHGTQSSQLADYYSGCKMGKVPQCAREKSFSSRAEGYNMKEKNVNQVPRMGTPMSLYDMFPETKPRPSMMIVEDQENNLVQKRPVQLIDFLGLGNVE